MKLSLARSSCALALALCTAGPALAQDVTFTFTGTLTYVARKPVSRADPGTPFAGCYTVNLATPESNGADWVADYWHTGAPYGITVQIGSHAFRTNTATPPGPQFLVELINDQYGQDNYLLRSYYNLPTDGFLIEHISWQLDDPTQQNLTSTELSGVPPIPSQWQQMFGLDIAGPGMSWLCAARSTPCRWGNALRSPPRRRALRDLRGRKDRRGRRACQVYPVNPDLPDRRGFRGRRVSLDHRASLAARGRRAHRVHRDHRALSAPPVCQARSALRGRKVKACSLARW